MLDKQDVEVIEEIVERKTSDLRQDVSILKQDMTEVKSEIKDLRRHMIVLHEDTKNEFKLLLENVGTVIKEALTPVQHHVYENHESRIARLEVAFTKNMAGKKKKSA